MTIRTKFKDGTFVPLEKVKEVKEGEIVEIEIKPRKKFSWKGALKYRKESSVELQHKLNLDCDDAIQYYICKTYNFKIVSFDKHFDSTDVERIEPKDIFTP